MRQIAIAISFRASDVTIAPFCNWIESCKTFGVSGPYWYFTDYLLYTILHTTVLFEWWWIKLDIFSFDNAQHQ